MNTEEGNACIYSTLNIDKPCLITKFGSVELTTASCYLDYRKDFNTCIFPPKIIRDMRYQAGFFSANNNQILKFSQDVIQIIKNTDVLGVYAYAHKRDPSEEIVLKAAQKEDIKLVPLSIMGDKLLRMHNPWTRALEGKNVLVIHPFAESIEKQYPKRNLIFKNNKVLPDFNLITLKAVQGINTDEATKQYGTWYNALEKMQNQINKINFDIALIGAGAFGMFLANHIKNIGKKAVHIGGSLQVLFGITGERWELYPWFKDIVNEHWVRPSDNERVKNLTEFVKGERNEAYW